MANPNTQQRQEPPWVRFVTGGLASMTAETVTIPVDVTKIRLQLQGSGDSPDKMYNGMVDCMRKTVKNEGIGGLYKGLAPAVLRQAVYSSIRMGVYEPIRNAIAGDNPNPSFLIKFASGASAGAIGSFVANPTDLVKIRMQADRTGTRYTSTAHAFKDILSTEGFLGMWKGCAPNVQRAILVNAAELSTYDQCKSILLRSGLFADGPFAHFTASFMAGFCAACVSSPVDVMKTRLMNQKAGKDRLYTGMIDCMSQTIKNEGVLALYKGFTPNWMRIGPWCVVMFMTYEQYRSLARSVWDK
eukprot:GILK01003303.1.p1 GENE.GILK01003303.1~~GILK01003303.1.p1  ORF type:complete len:300 (-),score=38.34 GILK01003303.1:731-1630(-)